MVFLSVWIVGLDICGYGVLYLVRSSKRSGGIHRPLLSVNHQRIRSREVPLGTDLCSCTLIAPGRDKFQTVRIEWKKLWCAPFRKTNKSCSMLNEASKVGLVVRGAPAFSAHASWMLMRACWALVIEQRQRWYSVVGRVE